MSELGDALSRALGHGESNGLAEDIAELKGRHGGVSGLARYLGVHRTTVQRWQRGATTPNPARLEQLGSEVRSDTRRLDQNALIVSGMDSDGRRRQIRPDQLRLAPGTMDAVRDKWIATGDGNAAAIVLWQGIGDSFYKDFFGDMDIFEDEGYAPDLDSDYVATAVWVAV